MRPVASSLAVVSLFVVFLVSCGPIMLTTRYTPSVRNLASLREIAKTTSNKITVSDFSGGPTYASCRGQRIGASDEQTLAELIKNAFVEELMFADLYSEKEGILINGVLEDMRVNCYTSDWNIRIRISSGGKSFVVENKYEYKGSFIGDIEIDNAKESLVPAVQEIIGNIINAPEFKSILMEKS